MSGAYINDLAFMIPTTDLYLLGILNSKLIWFYLKNVCSTLGNPENRGRLMLYTSDVSKIPIVDPISLKRIHVEKLVNNFLTYGSNIPEAAGWQQEIDRIVYEIYGLTDEEIALVEGH